jgi:hypothetical protein
MVRVKQPTHWYENNLRRQEEGVPEGNVLEGSNHSPIRHLSKKEIKEYEAYLLNRERYEIGLHPCIKVRKPFSMFTYPRNKK